MAAVKIPHGRTHIDGGGFCDRFFLGLYFTRRLTCSPPGKIEPQKKSVTERPPVYVCKIIRGYFCVIKLFILKKCDGQYRKQWAVEETEQLTKA